VVRRKIIRAPRNFGKKTNNILPLILLIGGIIWLGIDMGYIDVSKYNISIWPVLIIVLALILLGKRKR